MTGIHIDEFYADAAHILVSLFGVFPRPVNLFAEDICGPDEPDEFGLHSNRYLACFSTMVWLGEEGYIRYEETNRQDAIDQAVLSGRCFSALLSPAPPNAEELEEARAEGSKDALPPSVQAEHATIIHHLERALKKRSSVEIRAAFLPLLQKMA